MSKPVSNYKGLISSLEKNIQKLTRETRLWSLIRLISFIVFVSIIVLLQSLHWIIILLLIYVFAYLFIQIVKKHNRLDKEMALAKRQRLTIDNELSSIEQHLGFKQNGEKYKDLEHDYASDLDLFGEQSVFHFFNRCQTEIGQELLSQRLKGKAMPPNVELFQEAIQELSDKTDWITAFESLNKKSEPASFDHNKLDEWKNLDISWSQSTPIRVIAFLFPIITILAFTFLCVKYSLFIALLSLLPNGLILKNYLERIMESSKIAERSLKTITACSDIFQKIEQSHFKSDLLQELKSRLFSESGNSSASLKKLDFYIDQLELKNNLIGGIIIVVSLWDFHIMNLLASWKKEHQYKIDAWISCLAEFEYLVSLSTVAHNNPDWVYPSFKEEKSLDAKTLGHPLLKPSTRVDNDISMDTEHHLRLVTGSNMAGKSTFLRAVGINIILAKMGSVVCASSFSLPNLRLLTSMRSQDALSESTSGFYAELKKLKRIIDSVNEESDCFYLIDEVLKGTNTNDRHKGSMALLSQLVERPSSGLVSTHDLGLAILEEQSKGKIENWCFEVEVNDNKLDFDYKINRGVSESFNATHLMRNMGIKV